MVSGEFHSNCTFQAPEADKEYLIEELVFKVIVFFYKPEDSANPVEAQLNLLGCFKPVPETTTTAVETTPGGVTTSPGAVTGTTGEVTQTAAGTTPLETAETTRGRQTTTPVPGTTTTEQPCPLVEGMDEPQLIPENWISTTSGDPGDIRPDSEEPWSSTPEDENPMLTITLLETPEPYEYVESMTLTKLDNVESFVVTVFTLTEELPSDPVTPEVC